MCRAAVRLIVQMPAQHLMSTGPRRYHASAAESDEAIAVQKHRSAYDAEVRYLTFPSIRGVAYSFAASVRQCRAQHLHAGPVQAMLRDLGHKGTP